MYLFNLNKLTKVVVSGLKFLKTVILAGKIENARLGLSSLELALS